MTTEKKPHKHAEILRAIADGITVQFREYRDDTWVDRQDDPDAIDPITNDYFEWRIKPEVKPDIVRYGVSYYTERSGGVQFMGPLNGSPNNDIKLTFDGETGKLKSAEVI